MEMDTNNIDAFITSYKKFAKDVKVLSEEYGLLKQWVDLILFQQQQSIENNTNLKNYLTLFSRAADLVRMERQFLYDGEKGFLLKDGTDTDCVCFTELEKGCTKILKMPNKMLSKEQKKEINLIGSIFLEDKISTLKQK